jgi:hypothetical protein
VGRRKLKRDRSQQLLVAQTLAFCRWWLSTAAAPTSTAKETAAITNILFMLVTIITKILLVSQKSFWPTGDRRSSPSVPMRFQPDPLSFLRFHQVRAHRRHERAEPSRRADETSFPKG